MKRRRTGIGLVEVAAATMLLGALATLVLQTVAWSAVERRAIERREIALAEAANAMERASTLESSALEPQPPTEIPLSPLAKNKLPGGKITREIKSEPGSPDGRRITVAVSWLNQAGQQELPVRLTTWIYR